MYLNFMYMFTCICIKYLWKDTHTHSTEQPSLPLRKGTRGLGDEVGGDFSSSPFVSFQY